MNTGSNSRKFLPVGMCDASLFKACRSCGLSPVVPETITSLEHFRTFTGTGRVPEVIVTWGFFNFWHEVRRWAAENSVPVVHGENGWFPHYRTFSADPKGFCWESQLCDTPFVSDGQGDYPEARRVRLTAREGAPAGELPPGVRAPYVLFAGQLVTDRVNTFGDNLDGFEPHVRHLRSILPPEVQLVVRPHPRAGKHRRNQDAMSRLAVTGETLPGTLMTGAGDLSTLILQSAGVVSINSTVLYEARLLYDKPTWAYGRSWFTGHERLIGKLSFNDRELPSLEVTSDYAKAYRDWFLDQLLRRQIPKKVAKMDAAKTWNWLLQWAAVPGKETSSRVGNFVDHGENGRSARSAKQDAPQLPPMFLSEDHHPLWLGNLFRGRSAFLIAGGPSFAGVDHSLLKRPGILSLGLNNAVKSFRPNLWVSVDPPDQFVRSVWLDPCIMKFAPICHAEKAIFNSDSWKFMDLRAGDCPNVVFFRTNERFNARQFLSEDTINWGNHKENGGGRSVMLAALRILFILGIRTVYLLGVDFRMNATVKYHFAQDRKSGSIRGNNATYLKLEKRFAELRPVFEAEDFHVFNCNPHSKLKVFDFVPYEEAVRSCLSEFDFVDVENERTEGLYDTKTDDKRNGMGE